MGNGPTAAAEGARRATGAAAAIAATEHPTPVSIIFDFAPTRRSFRSGIDGSSPYTRRRPTAQAAVATLMIAVREVTPQPQTRFRGRLVVPKVHVLVLYRSPQPLDHDVVKCTAHAVHADRDTGLLPSLESPCFSWDVSKRTGPFGRRLHPNKKKSLLPLTTQGQFKGARNKGAEGGPPTTCGHGTRLCRFRKCLLSP